MKTNGECYVITHGLGGSAEGDRFHRLAAAIRQGLPQTTVVRIDWSERATARFGGFLNPWKAAESIDDVGDEAAQVLARSGIDPTCTTFIGESFGNWVNARVASELGGVQGILALNPAHETGGYAPPDLRMCARRSCSFHTYSVFDTSLEIADSEYFLETSAEASHFAQHIAGIDWLAARIERGDLSWLRMDHPLPPRRAGYFRAVATLEGEFSDKQFPRSKPVPASKQDVNEDAVRLDAVVAGE